MTDEQLKAIEDYGLLAMAPEKVAVIVQLDVANFRQQLDDPGSEIHQAYFRGVYKREAELRQVIFEQALSGSTPAQALALKYFEDLKLDLLKI